MDTATIRYNASDLDSELTWLAEIIDMRIRLKTGQKSRYRDAAKIKPPSLRRSKSNYGRFVLEHGLDAPERFLLILAMVPHIRPNILDAFYGRIRLEADAGRDDARLAETSDLAAPRIADDESKAEPETSSTRNLVAEPQKTPTSGQLKTPVAEPSDTSAAEPSDTSAAEPPDASVAELPDASVAVRNHSGFLPTGETAMLLFADNDLEKRLLLLKALGRSHPFARERMLRLEEPPPGHPMLKGELRISEAALRLFTTGEILPTGFDPDFPATRMRSELQWEDLVLTGQVQTSLSRMEAFLRNRDSLTRQWQQEKHHKPGLPVLFHGPPGTGKTMAAAVLAGNLELDLYKIDLSAVVSKYIGETEKNLSRIFEEAENRQWILFFDEADALFGKRTSIRDANDRYIDTASAQASSLLFSFMENYPGLAILSMDLLEKPDDRLLRRFELAVHFAMPGEHERLRLWTEGFGKGVRLDRSVDLKHLAGEYELSGGTIMKVIRFASLNALHRNSRKVALSDILEGIVHHKPD